MVSVVITTHNRGEILFRAIDSVLSQSYKDIELIVVSDGSSDGTSNRVKKYENLHNFRFIEYFPSKGANYARNIGIKESKGEYIAFLDDDDEWLESKLTLQLEQMNSDSNIGIVYTSTNIIYQDEAIKYKHICKRAGDFSRSILLSNIIGTTSTVMVRKSVIDNIGYFDEDLPALQDWDLWIRICQVALVGVVSIPMVNYYNKMCTNQISSNTQKYERARIYINNKYHDLFKQLSHEELEVKEYNDVLGLYKRCIRNGEYKSARAYLSNNRKLFKMKYLLYYINSLLPYRFMLRVKSLMSLL